MTSAASNTSYSNTSPGAVGPVAESAAGRITRAQLQEGASEHPARPVHRVHPGLRAHREPGAHRARDCLAHRDDPARRLHHPRGRILRRRRARSQQRERIPVLASQDQAFFLPAFLIDPPLLATKTHSPPQIPRFILLMFSSASYPPTKPDPHPRYDESAHSIWSPFEILARIPHPPLKHSLIKNLESL